MEKYYTKTIGLRISSVNGENLGKVDEVIINPESGKIEGFLVKSFIGGKKVVSAIDVIEWRDELQINDQEDIVEMEEVFIIKKIIESKNTVFKKQVYTKSGDYIGFVIDIGFNNLFFNMSCLVVAKGFMGMFFWNKKIISSKDIIRITKKRIIVKDLVKPIKMRKLRVKMAGAGVVTPAPASAPAPARALSCT